MSASRASWRLLTVSVLLTAALCMAAVSASAQTVLWQEDFTDVSDWTTFQATISSDGDIGTIDIPADPWWGKAELTDWVDAPFGCAPSGVWMNIDCTAITGRIQVRIMDVGFAEFDVLVTETPGVYDVDLDALLGWTGRQAFKVVVYVDWAAPASASFDVMTITTTADMWEEEFEPIQAGWRDETTNPGFNAYITDAPGPYVMIEEAPGVDFGKVLSPVLTVDVDQAPTLTVVVIDDADNSNFLIGIQEEEGAYEYRCLGRGYDGDVFQFNYKEMMQWTGVHSFSIQIGVESEDVDGWVTIDRITLDCSESGVPEHACCFELDSACYMMTHWNCLGAGGVPYDCYTCESSGGYFSCPAWQVCCVMEECLIMTETACAESDGMWHPEWSSCGPPNPCLVTPADDASWGAIKALYR